MLTEKEKSELSEIETRKIDRFNGRNLVREIFRGKEDADRWLELSRKKGSLTEEYYSYGAPCTACVQKGHWNGKTSYEVYHG